MQQLRQFSTRRIALFFICLACIALIYWSPFDKFDSLEQKNIFNIGYFYSDSETIDFQNFSTTTFEERLNYSSYGYKGGNHWFKVPISKANQSVQLIEVSLSSLDEVELIYERNDGVWAVVENGDHIPLEQRPVRLPGIWFALSSESIKGEHVYFRVQSEGPIAFGVTSKDWYLTFRPMLGKWILIALYLISLSSVSIGIGYYGLKRQDRVSIVFAIALVLKALDAAKYFGLLHWLFPTASLEGTTVPIVGLGVISIVGFHHALMRELKYPKYADRVNTVFLAVSSFSLLASLVLTDRLILTGFGVIGLIYVAFLFIASFFVGDSKYLNRRYIISFYGFYITSILIWLLPSLGLIPANRISFYGPVVQNFVFIFFIYGFFLRINYYRKLDVLSEMRRLEASREAAETERREWKLFRDYADLMIHQISTQSMIIRNVLEKSPLDPILGRRAFNALDSMDAQIEASTENPIILNEIILRPEPIVNVIEILEEEMSYFDMDFVTHFESIRGARGDVAVDLRSLGVVFSNLLSNMHKYRKQGSAVCLGGDIVEGNLHIYFSNYKDKGREINLGRVFERFYRDGSSINTIGMGLGLYISKYLIDRMGGYVELRTPSADLVRVELRLPVLQHNKL